MANRSIIYDEEQVDPFDILWQIKDLISAVGAVEADICGTTTTLVCSLGATPTTPPSLLINLAAGRIYQSGPIDAEPYGALAADETIIQQQGMSAAQQVEFSTAALVAGQSQFALVQASFSQQDVVRAGDPTGGVLNYWNSANPTQPFQGQNNNGQPQPTERQATIEISVIYGTPAVTGSEAPPLPSTGSVPLFLVDLAFGQTTIAANQIFVAGPSATGNVPNNYPQAPFLAGLLNSHHGGVAGQAPKINLQTEVQGVLPLSNMPSGQTRTSGVTADAIPLTNSDSRVGFMLTGPATTTLPPAPVGGTITLDDLLKNFSLYNVVVMAPLINGRQSYFASPSSNQATTVTLNIDGQSAVFAYGASSRD